MKLTGKLITIFLLTLFFSKNIYAGKLVPPSGFPEPAMSPTLQQIYEKISEIKADLKPVPPALPAKTGQTKCYDVGGVEISCVGTGQDGDLQRGADIPALRFTDNGDGTVTDNLTKLTWLKNANAFGLKEWETAITDCVNLASGSAGLTDGSAPGDWRLPNVRELRSLNDYGNNSPALPTGHPFINVHLGYYWSSTYFASAPSYYWPVNMEQGGSFEDWNSDGKCVWPVKGGNDR